MPRRSSALRPLASLVLAAGLLAACLSPAAAQGPAATPRWFRGNLHTHSLWSDGNDFPEMICAWYKARGYHFLALSDHNILSEGRKWIDVSLLEKRNAAAALDKYQAAYGPDWVETRTEKDVRQVRLKPLNEFRPLFDEPGKFLLVQGEEITDSFASSPIHINASNLRELIKPQGGKSVRDTIANNLIAIQQQAQRIGQPILAHVNHPNFGYAITAEELADVVEEQFFEVYNGHPDVHHAGDAKHAGLERIWDVANTIRVAEMKLPPLYGLATDDSHNYHSERGATPGRGWVMVRAKHLTPVALIHAMQAGDFYASSGVEVDDVRYDPAAKTLEVVVHAEPGRKYAIEFVGTRKNYDRASRPIVDDQGKEIRATRQYSADVGRVLAKADGPRAAYRFSGDELYVRAVVTADIAPENPAFEGQRRQAWTQPVGWEKQVAPRMPPAAPATPSTTAPSSAP